MQSENDQTLLKLQKDFIRDIVEELKNVCSDIRYAMGAANEDEEGIQDAIKQDQDKLDKVLLEKPPT